MENDGGVSTMRLYGAAIAVVSGLYSAYLSVGGMWMTWGGWFMLGLGAVVIVHGIALLTPAAGRLGSASGPLMIGYAVAMLLNQARIAAMGDTGAMSGMGGMDGGMGGSAMDGTMAATAAMGTDAGMVAIAALMLASGVIMTARDGSGRMDGRGE